MKNVDKFKETLLDVVQNRGDNDIPFLKKGGKTTKAQKMEDGGQPKIHIKKENKGKFTDYCGGKVTQECISRGKNSSNPTTRKRATFAANARKWKHEDGGMLGWSKLFQKWKASRYGQGTDFGRNL